MQKPNILVFMTDQQRADSVTGNNCNTPNLDKLREQGITFNNTFCPSPHCCPSRATFMSGLYPSQHGVWHNVNVTNAISRTLDDGVRLWSEDLADAGYSMAYSGKWHVSAIEGPTWRGWKEYPDDSSAYPIIQHAQKSWENFRRQGFVSKTERKESEIIREGWSDYHHYGNSENPFGDATVVDAAIEVIRNRKENSGPWCQYVGTLGPHDPYKVPQEFLDMYKDRKITLPENFDDDLAERPNLYKRTRDVFGQLTREEHIEAICHYLAFCTYEDYLFGRVLNELKENNQLENTLIIYLSDHGDYTGEHGLWCKGLPCFQGAYRIPLVMAWGKGIVNPGREVDDYVSLADFAPTFLEAAGIDPDREFFGSSLMPFMRDESPQGWRDVVYTQSNGNEQYGIQRSVMTGKWKYVYNGFDYDELYDLENDPLEMKNVITQPENQEVVKEMCKRMWQLGFRTNDNCINPYIMIGFAPYGPGIAFE